MLRMRAVLDGSCAICFQPITHWCSECDTPLDGRELADGAVCMSCPEHGDRFTVTTGADER